MYQICMIFVCLIWPVVNTVRKRNRLKNYSQNSFFQICYEVTPISSDKWVKPHSPYYDAPRNRLLFVDLTNATIVSYDLATKAVHQVLISGIETPAFIIPLKCKKDTFLVGNHLNATKIQWDGISSMGTAVRNVFTVQPQFVNNNFLAGKVSPQCKFYGGTYRRGSLHIDIRYQFIF